jgi:Holliday junction resolvasome RuvABC ATP-dependent DNA helicase subunit
LFSARTNSFLSSQATSDQLYVTSTLHEGAKRKLKHNSFIVICGPPGEGKTTMAAKLMCEIAEPTSRFKLNDPGELELLFTRRSNQIVFIDDIFGEGLFSESLFNKWSTVLSEIKQFAKFLILTTRDYI